MLGSSSMVVQVLNGFIRELFYDLRLTYISLNCLCVDFPQRNQFPKGFYVVFIVNVDDTKCLLNGESRPSVTNRTKQIIFDIERTVRHFHWNHYLKYANFMIYWSDFCKRIGIGALHLDVERLCGIYCLGYRYVSSGGDQTQTKSFDTGKDCQYLSANSNACDPWQGIWFDSQLSAWPMFSRSTNHGRG